MLLLLDKNVLKKPMFLIASCTRPRSITNGAILGNDFKHSKRVTYRCNGEYVLFGDSQRKCIDGVWSGTEPLCKGTWRV